MERKEFLRKSLNGLGLLAAIPVIKACAADTVNAEANTTTSEGSTNGSSSTDCTVTNSETAGPFPTKSPSTLVQQNITSDRAGVPMQINILIKRQSTGCNVLADAIVDIWHCDANGYYSEYGGTGMQSTNFTNVHFLRGRQITDANGQVSFKSIFPGWYSGRAVHIHVHIFDSSGNSLLVTQIAFPKEICDTVFNTATSFYTKGTADTTNERDGIFGDGYANELAGITGNVMDGYLLEHTIVV